MFELRPVLAVPATQAWFWTPEWQQKEQEAEADVAAGRVLEFADVDRFLSHLGEPDASASRPTGKQAPASRGRVAR